MTVFEHEFMNYELKLAIIRKTKMAWLKKSKLVSQLVNRTHVTLYISCSIIIICKQAIQLKANKATLVKRLSPSDW